ncbi:ATP-NAD kinase-like domain-containing protein, partial [Elsinoe ampelina]
MVDVSRGAADGVEGTWMWKDGEAGEMRLTFLNDAKGASELGLELDPKSIVAVVKDEVDPTAYTVIVVEQEDTVEGKPPPIPSIRSIPAKGLPPDFVTKYGIDKSKADLFNPEHRITVIISTKSGTKQAASFNEQTIKPLFGILGLLPRTTFYTTTSTTSITEYTHSTILSLASSNIKQHILLLSGDGGTIDLLNALLSSPLPTTFTPPLIYPLPFGTGNALSNSYLYTTDSTWGLSTLLRGTPRPLPSFRATFSPSARLVTNEGRDHLPLPSIANTPTLFGAVVCSRGLHSTLVADSDTAHYRQFGAARFGMVAKELLFPPEGSHHVYKGTVKIKDPYTGEWESAGDGEHSYILATMVSNLEKTFVISPDSKTLDGMMRLVRMGKMDGTELMGVMEGAYQEGKHVGMQGVHYREVDGVRIEVVEPEERWRRVCVDGTIVALEQGGWVQVEKEGRGVVEV